MITKTDITTCSQNQTHPVHVLFFGDRPISGELTNRLNENGYLWDCVSSGDFNSCIHSRNILGTVIVDAGVVTAHNAAIFQELFKQLDQKDISIILYNCPDSIPLDELPLASKIDSVDYEPLWARIESNVKFYKRLQRDLAQKDVHACQLSLNEDTLEMAGHVQRNFLPTRLPHAGNIRWATMFRPAEWVSGDIYDIARLDEEHIGFYLADAVGHSMPAALLTMFLKQAAIMRQTINDKYTIFKPWEVITTLNLRMSEQELAGCLFATCFYGLLNINTLKLDYARAGHPYPVLIRDNQLVQLQSRGGLLGVFPEADFEQKSIQLQSGDKLFVFSDGAEPLLGDSDDEGQFRFNEAFSEICRLPIEPMIEALSNIAKDYHFKPGEIDDVTAVAMEIL
ncbi:MAG: PP2C family protein-serine/threonine phosphatase [Planctomycetota bacterium]|jgi:sigma-B regulation protein RsbU (phosphoserine phosphatase)